MPSQSPDASIPGEGRPEHARRLFLIVGILALFGLIGGYWSLKTSIEQPLAFTNENYVNRASLNNAADEDDAATIALLQSKDTDKDGLSDYDELYDYGSSPYLADSDSDGVSDKDEVENGDDPNCPTGTTCSPIAVFTPSFTNSSTNSSTTGSVDAAELRATLKNAGAPQSELDALSDEELLALYADVLAEENPTNQNTNSGGLTDVDIAELRELTPAEIRQLLIAGGADEATLNEIDDETLQAIYLESLQNIQTSS